MHKEIAKWLYDKIMQEESLYHSSAVTEIATNFGEEFIHTNQNGNPAIDKKVLHEFGKLKGDDIVWEKGSDPYWRKKTEIDRQLDEMALELPKIDLPSLD